jgi:hypothetical protein
MGFQGERERNHLLFLIIAYDNSSQEKGVLTQNCERKESAFRGRLFLCRSPLLALEAERQDGGDQEQRHQLIEALRRQAEAEQDGWTGEQGDEDHEQDAEPPFAVRLPLRSLLRLL